MNRRSLDRIMKQGVTDAFAQGSVYYVSGSTITGQTARFSDPNNREVAVNARVGGGVITRSTAKVAMVAHTVEGVIFVVAIEGAGVERIAGDGGVFHDQGVEAGDASGRVGAYLAA